ncbi:hypothetical protein FB107DRAFT_290974 [Schizophyllum commune]
MAPGRPVRDIVVKVPRHNADILRKDLAAKVHAAAKDEDMNVQLEQTPSEEVARAVESASEWNSLLMTARAERGPQWDIGTQRFHVDAYSDLYYDPTSLLASTRQALGTSRQLPPRGSSQAPMPPAASAARRDMDMIAARGAGMSPPRDMGMGMGGMGGAPPGMRPDMGDQVIGGMRGFPAGMSPAAMRAGMGMGAGMSMGGGGLGAGMGGPGGLPNPGMGLNGGMGGGGGMAGMGNMGMGMNNMGRMGGMPANMAGNMPGGMGMGSMGMGGLPPGATPRRMM